MMAANNCLLPKLNASGFVSHTCRQTLPVCGGQRPWCRMHRLIVHDLHPCVHAEAVPGKQRHRTRHAVQSHMPICRNFVHGNQEDAHEFLRYLIRSLDDCSKPFKEIFEGCMRQDVRCLNCSNTSSTYTCSA